MSRFARTPGGGKYVRLEREQRWLLKEIPEDASDAGTIYDRYITGTPLRLRRVERGGGVT